MKTKTFFSLIVCVLALCPVEVVAQRSGVLLRGVVTDARTGRPLKGVEVSTSWSFAPFASRGYSGVMTDKRGRFGLEVQVRGRPVVVMAIDEENMRGAIGRYDPQSDNRELDLALKPLCRVHGEITSDDPNNPPTWTNAYAYIRRGDIRVAQSMSQAPYRTGLQFLLPEGEYELDMYGTGIDSRRKIINVAAQDRELDLGEIRLSVSREAKLMGKVAPALRVTDARGGVDSTVKLTDFKGRYVLLEFWGHW